ncbi:amino acid ABC transporter permease [Candidatus Thorarchaeota archaeon]|nr:MAG: amino acid ABC transporter permease [Candidatus Thorarchaeota archaeon]
MSLTIISPDRVIGILQIERYYPDLVSGFFMSMGLYFFALFFGFGLGLVLAVSRHYGGPVTSRISTAFIEFMRGTPLLAQILAVNVLPYALNAYLEAQGMAPFDTSWRITFPDIVGVPRTILNTTIVLCAITLGLNSGAYQAEFFRGSMASISAGQSLAAQSIGMTKRQEIRHVALPQSLRRAIPAWSNEAVYLPKYTTIAYMVGVPELFGAAKLIVSRTYQALLVYALVAVIFLLLITFISWVLNVLYERYKIPGL